MLINFESICRLCMMSTKPMVPLFDDGSHIPKKIMVLIPSMKIFAGDNLPRQVCEECVNQINNFDKFKLKCENSDLTLNKYLCNLQLENEKMKERSNIPNPSECHFSSLQSILNSETWRLSSGSSSPSEKVVEGNQIENNCEKEEIEENQFSEVKIEDNPVEYEYGTLKDEPEIEFTITDESHITKDGTVNKTISNSDKISQSKPVLPSKPFNVPCDICGKMVPRKRITRHVKRHTVGRPFKCGVCGKMYIDQSSLKIHSVIHSGLKPHMCHVCGKRFKLLTHLKNHHLTHTGQKSYVCDVCGKRFTQIGNLKKHNFIHTGEKPFSCDMCGKSYTEKNTLQIHLAVHSGLKQHVCEICGKEFLSKGHLKDHLVVHSGEKRFCCDICGNRYSQRHSLKKHKVKHDIHK